MIYEDTVKLLTSQGKFRVELGLERISKALELLGNPQDKLKCIHVAGTNGKGSVCAICDAIFDGIITSKIIIINNYINIRYNSNIIISLLHSIYYRM